MNIVKSLHSSLLHKCFSYQEKHFFSVSVLWGFNLQSGEPVLEQEMWQCIGDMLGKNEMFDAGLPKPNAELLVHGSCFAARGKKIDAGQVSVSLGSISKQLLVFGNRQWIKAMGVGWGVTDPEPFSEMPISYANAFGGKDYAPNPLGKGIDEIDSDGEPVIEVPNIEYENQLIGSPNDRPDPASYNRNDMMCQLRMLNAGTYDQKYIETRMPAYPDDLNYDYFNDAAKDQRMSGYFNGNEEYEIHNMNPDHPLIKGRIPGVYGRAFVNHEVNDKLEFKEIPTRLDTVWFFPGAELGVMIHRGVLQVNEDDAADIKQILIANENSTDTPRDLAHYKNELELRTDPEESFKYLLYTAPLIPQGCTCGFKSMQDKSEFPLELLANSNMAGYAETKKEEARQSLDQQIEDTRKNLQETGMAPEKIEEMIKQMNAARENAGELDPDTKQITAIMEKVLPGVTTDPQDLDLTKLNLKAMDEFKDVMEKLQQDKKAETKQTLVDQVEEFKKAGDDPAAMQSVEQLEKIIAEFDLPPLLPRINTDEILKKMDNMNEERDKQLLVMQSMGVPEESLQKLKSSFNQEENDKKIREGLEKASEGYRIGAHYIDKARSPHPGKESNIREQLIEAYQANGQTSHGDYAYIDLSNLDLSGINLSGSYLEYANLTNTNLSNANLSKAILSHAIVNNTNFTDANLTDANLGAINFEGGRFVNADLSGAVLGKSRIRNTLFKQCKMADKMDMFLETEFDKASFIESDLHKSIFLDADISGCDFSGSDLSESNFVNPIMKNTNFGQCNLSAVNFVNAEGSASKYDHATMINVRFVGGSTLNNTDFQMADASESNLRECDLQNAKFTGATLFKTDFGKANLKNANFDKSIAKQAQFNKADLTHASLQSCDLMEGSMYKAILSGAQFANANLYGVNFMGCTIGETDFTGAYVEQTIFKDWKPQHG